MNVLLVTNMYPTPKEPAFGTFVQDQVQALRRVGVEIDVLFINGRQSSLNYLGGIFRLWGRLLRRRYDLIHAHYAMSGFVARLQYLRPVVVTYHGGEVRDHVPNWLKIPARRGAQIFDHVIVVNQQEKELIVGDGSKVSVVPGGINFDVFAPMPQAEARTRLDLPADKPLVLWAGEHWQFEKRFELVEASMEALKERCPEAELILVSGQPHSVIPLYMNACDALLLTSRSEGSPTVVKEAMACNLPVVSTDVGDVAQMIAGVGGCYLVEPGVQDVVDKLLRVLQKRQRTQGRAKIAHLSSERVARRVVQIYNKLCPPDRRIELGDDSGGTLGEQSD